ncbi:unnamed protein product [marine sediment metagenome]|uniref:Uncharacterized protein n=1 Tax=marine sediment metagenome TaxID=412755 RepID=X0YPT8_9ZZZZ
MPIDDYIKQFSKYPGQGLKPEEPEDKPTNAEIKYRQRRKKKKRMVKASKRRNR